MAGVEIFGRGFFRAAAIAIGLLATVPALAQVQPGGGVSVTGQVSAGNCAKFASQYSIQDAGSPCGGAGGSPGGTNGQVQYNNVGSFGGLTDTQLTALINQFSSSLAGVVPASGGGTTNYLRADGSWAAPAGAGGVTSFNTRTGAVVPASGDYTFSQIGSTPTTVSGYGITDALTITGSQTPTNKTISGSTNTLTNIPNVALTNSAMTIGGQSISLGGTTTNQGTGGKLQLSTGTTTTNDCVKFDSTGNTVDAGAACGSGGSVTFPTSGYAVISAGPSSNPTGVAEVDGDCLAGSGGSWTTVNCLGVGYRPATSATLAVADFNNAAIYTVTASGVTLTVPHTTTLTTPTNSGVTILAQGGAVTIQANASDTINGGSSGGTYTVASGTTASMTTDGAGHLYVTGGASSGSGTVTSVTCGTGLSGGTITGSGTCAFASIAADNVLANSTGSSAAPIATALTSCSTGSSALTYNTSTHAFGCNSITGGVTFPTSGDVVVSNGTSSPAGVAPVNGDCLIGSGSAWVAGSCSTGSGTVTSLATNNGLTGGTITTSGTIGLAAVAADNLLMNSTGSSAAPIATALTSCSGASSALTYNTSTHAFGCNTISGGGGSADTPGYIAGQYYTVPYSSNGSVTPSITRLYMVPFKVRSTTNQTFTKIGINVTVLGTTTCRLGIYNNSAGVPTSLLLDAGTVSDVTTGAKTITISQTLTALTYYWLVVGCDDTTASIAGTSSGDLVPATELGSPAMTLNTQEYGTWTFGSLPGTFPTVTYNGSTSMPLVWLAP